MVSYAIHTPRKNGVIWNTYTHFVFLYRDSFHQSATQPSVGHTLLVGDAINMPKTCPWDKPIPSPPLTVSGVDWCQSIFDDTSCTETYSKISNEHPIHAGFIVLLEIGAHFLVWSTACQLWPHLFQTIAWYKHWTWWLPNHVQQQALSTLKCARHPSGALKTLLSPKLTTFGGFALARTMGPCTQQIISVFGTRCL